MSSLVGDDIKHFSYPIKRLLRARIKQEKRTQHIRHTNGLSRSSITAKDINKSILPLSSDKDGKIKPSPLRKVESAADIAKLQHIQPLPSLPSITPLRPLAFLMKIPTRQGNSQSPVYGSTKRPRFG